MAVWQEKRLGEVAEINMGQSPKSIYYNKDNIGTPFLQGNGDFGRIFPIITTYTSSVTKLAHAGDILFSVRAPVGAINIANTAVCIGRGLSSIRSKENYNHIFLRYSLEYLVNEIKKSSNGAIFDSITKNDLYNSRISIPDLATQEKIADILSTYDDLIENNNRRIEILEQMAQEIYKEWFIRFRFPGHEKVKFINGLPEGWEVKKIKDIVDRKSFGTLYKESQVQEDGKVIVIDQSKKDYIGFHNNEPSHNADIETPMILFGDHSCKYKIMIRPFSLAENVIPFISNDENLLTTYYLFYSINGIIQTTEYKRHWTDLTNKKIIISNINLQTKFEEKIKEFLLEIEQLSIINRNLIKQRDLLLPRLMSGKLEV